MGLFITSLNSGSNANCYFVGNGADAVLIDAGLSAKETVKRMHRLGLSMEAVKAVFVSHEHADHVLGLNTLHKKFKLPVYITAKTRKHSMLELDNALVFPFLDGRPIRIGGLEVVPFKKYHDAADAHSFIVKGAGFTVGVMTDLGYACDVVKHYFSLCDAVFLEANYDTDMLMNGKYPPALKRRISGGNGHLSNVQALELFLHHRSAHLQLLILSHLSKNNNRPEIVSDVFQPHAGKVAITIAGRNSETAVFSLLEKKFFPYEKPLFEKTTYPAKAGSTRHKTTRKKDNVLQLRLF